MKNKKMLVLVAAIALLLCVAVGGTLAWLTAESTEVKNTFTATSLSVELEETKPTGKDTWVQPLLPGATYDKDPSVKLGTESANAWVFVEIVEENNDLSAGSGNKVTYTIGSDWVQVKNGDAAVTTSTPGSVGIWMYKKEALTKTSTAVPLLTGGTGNKGSVTVNTAVTSDDMTALPSITFHAYALQSENLTINGNAITGTNAATNAYAMWQLVGTN